MSIEPAKFPLQVWDGLSQNGVRTSRLVDASPNSQDWDQATAEVIALETKVNTLSHPTFAATSTTSHTAVAGSIAFTTQAGLGYGVGSRVRATSTVDTSWWAEGVVTAYSSTTLTVAIDLVPYHNGDSSPTITSWKINLQAQPGADGDAGMDGLSSSGPGGRLTLTSGLPVTVTDVTGATTLYYTPHNSNLISLYLDGWHDLTFDELSLDITGFTTTQPYDIFVGTAGTSNLHAEAWASPTLRAVALTSIDGILVNSQDTIGRYVGTIQCSSTGHCEDSKLKRFVYNYYNKIQRPLAVQDATATWTYGSILWRQARANSANKVEFVLGFGDSMINASVITASNTMGFFNRAVVGIGVDSTSVPSGQWCGQNMSSAQPALMRATFKDYVAAGYHYLAWIEKRDANASTATFYGAPTDDTSASPKSGLSAIIRM